MKYMVVKLKKGFMIQNTETFNVLGYYPTKAQADKVCANLNK